MFYHRIAYSPRSSSVVNYVGTSLLSTRHLGYFGEKPVPLSCVFRSSRFLATPLELIHTEPRDSQRNQSIYHLVRLSDILRVSAVRAPYPGSIPIPLGKEDIRADVIGCD